MPPPTRTVVAHGTGQVDVERPRRRTDASIERVARVARTAALPLAVNAARADAIRLARAAGVTLGKPIGVERMTSPYGYGFDEAEGAFGPGQWCRRWRGRRRCHVPSRIAVRITLTVAAS